MYSLFYTFAAILNLFLIVFIQEHFALVTKNASGLVSD